jgi:DNA repair exonuclease SbcCD ATPase subunit
MVELENKCKAVEAENKQLRQRMQNSQILQDEIERLTAKYERARRDLEAQSQLQVEHENLLKQTAKWYAMPHMGPRSDFAFRLDTATTTHVRALSLLLQGRATSGI